MNDTIQFGIPSVDELFGRKRINTAGEPGYDYGGYGIHLTKGSQTTSISLIGPDGTGKSVFGLHLASQYVANAEPHDRQSRAGQTETWFPRILYVSTDLRHNVAQGIWDNFGLAKPNERDFPFYRACRRGHPNKARKVNLAKLDPANIKDALSSDYRQNGELSVNFVDLVSKTMGDDWGFINRLLAVLETPPTDCAPHLLVIDAVEGFETLVGEKDAYGEVTTRRARIAQIMRTAGDKCHVCFIVEEPRIDERFPEEFVTDVVIRLRNVMVANYSRRTIEIVKARGQCHVRGQHAFVIRDAKSRMSIEEETNADEPNVNNSYVHVFASLHYLSREEMKSAELANLAPRTDRVAAFGITYLDEMLARLNCQTGSGLDDQGLPAQTTTALIGQVATQKTTLATAFLARTFRAFMFQLAEMIRSLESQPDAPIVREALKARLLFSNEIDGAKTPSNLHEKISALTEAIRSTNSDSLKEQLQQLRIPSASTLSLDDDCERVRFAAWLAGGHPDNGAAVLVTTSDQDRRKLVDDLNRWLGNSQDKAFRNWPKFRNPLHQKYQGAFREAVKAHLISRTICRRLELHDLSSATLFQIIQRSVQRAQQKVFLADDLEKDQDRLPYDRCKRFTRSWNIRVVLDDLSTLKDAYPEIGSDPIFLPFLLSFLEREGVTSLIVDSQQGRPDAVVTDALDRELRALVLHKILTWSVPFFGGMRDAITLVPPYPSGLPSLVREVRWQTRERGTNVLIVDPELELYAGLERGEPKPIPLDVRLYSETGPTAEYIAEQNEIFGQLFAPVSAPASSPASKVISGIEPSPSQYDLFRDFCNLQTNTLLNHTLVFQIDEFWAINRKPVGMPSQFPRGPVSRREGKFYPLGRYLTENTSVAAPNKKLVADQVVDPFGVFQGEPIVRDNNVPREGPWQRRHYFIRSNQGHLDDLNESDLANIDRVPYTWDFGFLLCPRSMWESAGRRKIGCGNQTVQDVWNQMPSVLNRKHQPYMRWRTFLGACKAVAQAQGEKTSKSTRVIDLSTLSEESFSCLVLEVWASEIMDTLTEDKQEAFAKSFRNIDWSSKGSESLIDWLDNQDYLLSFYKTWLLLIDVIILPDVVDRSSIPRLRIREGDEPAAATRHWYKTACRRQKCSITGEFSLPVRLPGHFSVRGDWFLAVASGSRSERVAYRALDLLSTRRASFRRMELGIGLPTRDLAPDSQFDLLPTALVKCDEAGRTTAVTYGELIGTNIPKRKHFSWLLRSQLRDYHRHSRIFQKWMAQLIVRWDDLRSEFGQQWQSGFDIYDALEPTSASTSQAILKDLKSWTHFKQMCKLLKEELNIASLSAPRSEADLASDEISSRLHPS